MININSIIHIHNIIENIIEFISIPCCCSESDITIYKLINKNCNNNINIILKKYQKNVVIQQEYFSRKIYKMCIRHRLLNNQHIFQYYHKNKNNDNEKITN